MLKLGIDLGATNIKIGIVNEQNVIIVKNSYKTMPNRFWKEVINDIAMFSLDMIKKEGLSIDEFENIGIGCPGAIDSKNGVVVFSSNLIGWKMTPLRDELKKLLKKDVKISNDANCAILGEVLAGAAKGYKNVILFTLGSGVGGGIVLDGKIFEGGVGGTELGHTVIDKNGINCGCGRVGCLEMYASARALINQTRDAALKNKQSLIWKMIGGDLNKIDGKTVFETAELGDLVAVKVLENYVACLGEGIVDIINIFRPEIILLSGGISSQGDNLTIPLSKYVTDNSYGVSALKIPEIRIATLGNDAGIVGAANL